MLKIGITGGIGAGKTTVCSVFQNIGIPVFNADNQAKTLLNNNKVVEFYHKEFGDVVFSNNLIDKVKLAKLIFNNSEALQKVNNFIHPLVYKLFDEWCLLHTNKPYLINEAALLFESQSYKRLDYTILIVAPIETRIKRVAQRDGFSYEDIKARMDKQLSEEQKIKMADFIIDNNEKELILPAILNLHNEFLKNK